MSGRQHRLQGPHSSSRVPGFGLLLSAVVVFGASGCGPSEASPDAAATGMQGLVEGMASALVFASERRWNGPRNAPRGGSRPDLPERSDSLQAPLAVHAEDPEVAARVLEALEGIAAAFAAEGWPSPRPDGGAGGDGAFDLYVAPTARLAEAVADVRAQHSFLDGHSAFALLDPGTADRESCIAEAYAMAMLLGLDPGEAVQWRRATAAHLADIHFGETCSLGNESAENPMAGPLRLADGASGAHLLSALRAHHGNGFVRDLWDLTRQHTWDGVDFRAEPRFWQAIEAALEPTPEPLDVFFTAFAVERYFARSPPEVGRYTLETLPRRLNGPALESYGSAYVRVDVRGAPPGSRLRVWLRGEYRVEFVLSASRLEHGLEESRIATPATERRAYLPVELWPSTEELLLAVTNVPKSLPNPMVTPASEADPLTRGFRLVFELVTDE